MDRVATDAPTTTGQAASDVVALALLLLTFPLYAQRGWALEVVVQRENNRPIPNATVELVFNDASRVLASATTDTRGRATVQIPTHKPTELGALNLFLYTEADRHGPELLALSGSPDRMFTVRLSNAVDANWARRTGLALQLLVDSGAQIIDILLPATGSAGLPAAPLVTGNPCDALPPGMNQCIRCPGLNMPTAVINGRVAYGRHKGKTTRELNQLCGNALL